LTLLPWVFAQLPPPVTDLATDPPPNFFLCISTLPPTPPHVAEPKRPLVVVPQQSDYTAGLGLEFKTLP